MFLEEYDTGVPQSPLLLLAIFSIASKYSTDPMCRSDPTRAQTAGENYCKTACRLVEEFLDRPRLSTVQGLFLLGKHLEETKNQTFLTKSFMYIGMAVRMALDMGLNRDCSGWGLGPPQVEYRNRTWWCLYVLDRAQGSINGRPFLIQDHDCAAGKP
ncbi:transcription factor domain-containing protein, partial [Dissophora ornata]